MRRFFVIGGAVGFAAVAVGASLSDRTTLAPASTLQAGSSLSSTGALNSESAAGAGDFVDGGFVDSGTPAAVVTIESPNPDGGSVYQTATTPVVVSGTATGVVTGFAWAPVDAGSTACTNDAGTNFACNVNMYVDAGIGNQVFVVTATGPDENGTDQITMDWQPAPTIVITTPADDPHDATASTLTVGGTINGDVRTVSSVTWNIVDAGTTACATDAGTNFSCSVTGLVEGNQTIVATAVGPVANGTDTVVANRIVAPTVTITAPNSGNDYDPPSSTVSVSGTIAHTATGATWNYADAGTTACSTDAGAYFDCSVTSLPSTATRTVTVTATNAAGTGTDTQTFGPAPPGAPVLLYSALYETGFTDLDPVEPIDNKGSKTDADLTQATSTARPTYLSPCTSGKMATTGFTGGAPCLSYDGGDWSPSGSFAAAISQPARVLTVIRFTSLPSSTNGIMFDNSSGAGSTRWLGFEGTANKHNASAGVGRTGTTVLDTTTYRALCTHFNTTSSVIYVDGASESSGNLGTNTQGSWVMGGRFDGTSQNSFSRIFMQGAWADGTTCAQLQTWVNALFTAGIPQT